MYFKPCIVKLSTLRLRISSSTFVISRYTHPPLVMHLHDDGHKSGRNMYTAYHAYNIK